MSDNHNLDLGLELKPILYPTTAGVPLSADILWKYLSTLVNLFFKILPIWESGKQAESLNAYMRSLQAELLGCKELIAAIHDDPAFLSLIAILQYLIDNPTLDPLIVKREIFKSISICNKLKARYGVRQEVQK